MFLNFKKTHHKKQYETLIGIERSKTKGKIEVGSKQQLFNQNLLRFVIDTFQPLNLVNKLSFQNLIHSLDDKIRITKSKTLVKQIGQLYLQEKEKISAILEKVKKVVVTADLWSAYKRF
jgi:hypothetical protein